MKEFGNKYRIIQLLLYFIWLGGETMKKKVLSAIGCFALLLGSFVIMPASTFFTEQPKCPDELLK